MSELVTISALGDEIEWRIKQGATFDAGEYELVTENVDGSTTPLNITGCTVRCEIRKKGLDVGSPIATATTPLLNAAAGKYGITLSKAQTLAIPAGELITDKASAYTFDVFLDWPSGITWELLHGNAFVFRRTTKS